MKKFILSLIFVTLFGLPVYAAGSYPDVAEDYENFKAIEFLDEREVVAGYPDGTFGPENLVNRAEAMKIITVAFGLPLEEVEYEGAYPDVDKEAWFYQYVMSADNEGIVSGYPDGTFKPGQTVNLAETLKMVSLASGLEVPEEVTEDVFLDVTADSWFAPYMKVAQDKNIVLADDFGQVIPGQAMTRAKFAEIIYRAVRVMENAGEAFPLAEDWQYFTSESLPFKMKYPEGTFMVTEKGSEVVFLRPDLEFAQSNDQRIYPNTAKVTVSVDKNDGQLLAVQYFENLRNGFSDATTTEFIFDDFEALEVSMGNAVDWYIYLDDGRVLALFTDYGDGVLNVQLSHYIEAMLGSLQYIANSGGADYSDLKSEIFKVVLVDGQGQAVIDQLPNALVIDVDTIGVGTGPVDYYYSAELDMTIKFERNSATILDTRDGETSSF